MTLQGGLRSGPAGGFGYAEETEQPGSESPCFTFERIKYLGISLRQGRLAPDFLTGVGQIVPGPTAHVGRGGEHCRKVAPSPTEYSGMFSLQWKMAQGSECT